MDKTKMAVAVFDQNASAYQDKFMDVHQYKVSLDIFCRCVERKDATVLEVACGPGNITRYLLEQRPDFKILGTDLSTNMLELARQQNPGAVFQLMDCRDIDKLDGKYDAVMCSFALPYLSKEEAVKLIAHAAILLNDKGVLYLSTMEDDYSKSGLETSSSGNQLYMHYHEAGYLVDTLKEHGFRVIDLKRQHFISGEVKMTDLIIVARLP